MIRGSEVERRRESEKEEGWREERIKNRGGKVVSLNEKHTKQRSI